MNKRGNLYGLLQKALLQAHWLRKAQVVNLSYLDMLRGIYNYTHMDSRARYFADDFYRQLAIIGPWFKAQDNIAEAEDYLRNTGLDWSDIKYHKLDLGAGSSMMSTLNFVSSNIERLYFKKKK